MGSVWFEGVRFSVWSEDHLPPHVHATYAEVLLVVEFASRDAASLRVRNGSIQPPNGSKSDVRHIMNMAKQHFAELVSLWEELHG